MPDEGAQMDRVREIAGCVGTESERYTGRNVGVAVLDTGIYPHEDIQDRIAGFYDVLNNKTNCYDDNGHGTHICGIIGSDGHSVNGRYRGIAPGCHFVGVKVLDARGNGSIDNLNHGIDWVLEKKKEFRIRVVNISVGMFPKVSTWERNRLIQSVEQLWDEGIVVVAAAGNNGPRPGSITYPGISRKIITVGTVQEQQAQRHFSGRGPTPFCVMKPEIIAPGLNIMSCKNTPRGYVPKSGTSMATPIVAGAVCTLLEKYPEFSPVQVKMRLHDTAKDIGYPKNIQGWGQIWIEKLLTGNALRRNNL